MRHILALALLLVSLTAVLVPHQAHAQATRTWVSGIGDDVNPCSRTAPCKTFAGAISKTAAGGEIDCLDPAGYGAVTITKSIVIDCTGTFGAILASGTNGININASGINVTLRGLSINGAGTTLGLRGINILAAASVSIENVTIVNFSQQGIADTRSSGGTLAIIDTIARNNTVGAGIAPGAPLKLLVDKFRALNNNYGISAGPNVSATIANSDLSNNAIIGIDNEGANIVATNNSISSSGIGVLNQGGTIRLSNNDIVFNTTAGINNASGTVYTYGTNRNNTTTLGVVTPAGGAGSSFGEQ